MSFNSRLDAERVSVSHLYRSFHAFDLSFVEDLSFVIHFMPVADMCYFIHDFLVSKMTFFTVRFSIFHGIQLNGHIYVKIDFLKRKHFSSQDIK